MPRKVISLYRDVAMTMPAGVQWHRLSNNYVDHSTENYFHTSGASVTVQHNYLGIGAHA